MLGIPYRSSKTDPCSRSKIDHYDSWQRHHDSPLDSGISSPIPAREPYSLLRCVLSCEYQDYAPGVCRCNVLQHHTVFLGIIGKVCYTIIFVPRMAPVRSGVPKPLRESSSLG